MNDWSEKDSALAMAALLGHAADWMTTKDAIGRGAKEKNPLLGESPSGAKTDQYFALTGGLGAAGLAAMPKEWRRPLMGAYAGFSGMLANQNSRNSKDTPKTSAEEVREGPLMMAALGGLLGHYLSDDVKVDVKMKRDTKGAVDLLLGVRKDF